jgi:hypothetical protein
MATIDQPTRASPLPPTLARFRTYGNNYAAGKDKAAVYDALRGRLLFKAGSTFNDPFEGKPHHIPAHGDPQKLRYIVEKYLRFIARDNGIPSPNRWAEERMRGKTPQQLTEMMIERSAGMNHDDVHLLCLAHPSTIPAPLPWSHYADSHGGVCIEFDTAIAPVAFAEPINYSTDYPTLLVPRIAGNEMDELQKTFLTKAKAWEYEQEYRVIRPTTADAGISSHLFSMWDGHVAVTRPEIAKSLTLGVKMLPELRAELIEWTRANAPHVQLFQAALHPSKYEVTRSPIQ